MKITRITIKNFLGLDHLDLALDKPVLLVSGPNAAGKTSLAHGLRFVLTDDLVRVEHKKDIKALIREGAKLGHVSVTLKNSDSDIEYTRSAATGHFTSKHPLPTAHPALQYCLDPPSFVEMDANARLSFLYYLMGVNRSAAAITKILEERGHAPAHIERIQTHLSGGFNAAHQHVKERITLLSGEWRGVTGENYGSVKAATWSSSAATEVDTSHMERLKQDIARFDTDIGALQSRHGVLTERAAERRRRAQSMRETQRIAGELEARIAAAKECQKKVDELTANERELREALEKAQASLTVEAHASQGTFFVCPECGAFLNYSRGECKVGKPVAVDVSAEIAAAEERVKDLQLQVNEVDGRRRIADNMLVDAINAVAASRAAVDTLKDIQTPDPDDSGDTADIDEKIGELTVQRFNAREALKSLEQSAKASNDAADKTRRALAIHEEIKALTALAADLAPDGLPGELLAKAMRPINERLRVSSVMAGWSSVSITTNGILIHSRPWALASSSERWRANAMIGCAIAELSGIKAVVLDSGDILEPSERARCIAWLSAIAGEMDTVIIMMTLKAPPKNLPENVQTCWLGSNDAHGD